MSDLLRSQTLPRVQQGQQQMTPQQQQFALGVAMNAASGANQQSFLDPSNQQQQQQQASQTQMLPNFPSMGMPGSSLPQSLTSRSAMLQAFNANPGHPNMRQLELIGLAQNQQPQNGVNFATRQQQLQQGMNGQQGMPHASPDMFSSPGMSNETLRRPSPNHANAQVAAPMGGQQPMQVNGQVPSRRPMNFNELNERASTVRGLINAQELNMTQMGARGSAADPIFMGKMRALAADLKSKKEYLNKVLHAMGQSAAMCVYHFRRSKCSLNRFACLGIRWLKQRPPSSRALARISHRGCPNLVYPSRLLSRIHK